MSEAAAPARQIRTDEEALAVAATFRDAFATGAAGRDRDRRLPYAEVAALSQSGLWAITVPAEDGGAEVRHGTAAEVLALLAEADGSIAQIPQNHFATVETLRLVASVEQRRALFARVLAGARFGNAEAERGQPAMLRATADGFRLDGEKAYSTGALFADLITVTARDEGGRLMLAIVEPGAPGLTLRDDWSGMGQRTTGSGTTLLDGVVVRPEWVMPLDRAFGERSPVGAFAQLLHAAIDLGLARGALRAAGAFVRERSRPFRDAGVARAQDDPLLLERFGALHVQAHAAEAMLARAALALDATRAVPGEAACAAASIAVAEAKVLTTEAALAAGSGLFELAGTHATLAAYNLDRFWRDARTHTLHDPVRWKYHTIGAFFLNGTPPPVRSYL